jgi:hypothetical protein
VVEWINMESQSHLLECRRTTGARAFVPSMRPTWQNDVVNGRPAIRFDGRHHSLAMLPLHFSGFAAVIRINSPGGALFGSQLALYQRFGPGTPGTNLLIDRAKSENKGLFFINGQPTPQDRVEVPFKQFVILSCEGAGQIATIGSNDYYERYTKARVDPETLSFLDGDVAELVLWGPLPQGSTDQREAIERYLSNRYNIPLARRTDDRR